MRRTPCPGACSPSRGWWTRSLWWTPAARTPRLQRAQELGAQVYTFPWVEDFAKARNFSFSKATQQYCLWLDADDVLTPQDREGFAQLKAALPPHIDVVMLPYPHCL